MGLFSRKKEVDNEPVKPLKEYLEQRDAEVIYETALSMMESSLSFGILSFGNGEGWATLLGYKFNDSKYEAIPKFYRDTKVRVDDLLKIAVEKGHSESAFLLAVLYEHGMFVEKDLEEAKKYYNIVSYMTNENGEASNGKLLAQAMKQIRADTKELYKYTDDYFENIAMSIWLLYQQRTGVLKENDKYNNVVEVFGEHKSLLDSFIALGFFLVCYYALTDNNPFSTYEAAHIMCTIYRNVPEDYYEYIFDKIFPGKNKRKIRSAGETLLGAFEDLCLKRNKFALMLANDLNYKFIFRC